MTPIRNSILEILIQSIDEWKVDNSGNSILYTRDELNRIKEILSDSILIPKSKFNTGDTVTRPGFGYILTVDSRQYDPDKQTWMYYKYEGGDYGTDEKEEGLELVEENDDDSN